MPNTIRVREITADERKQLEKLCQSRTAEKRMVERATIVLRCANGEKRVEVARDLGLETDTITRWVKRFNEAGINGLNDREGRGRKMKYDEHQRGQMIALARTKPDELELPFATWSVRRLQIYLKKHNAILVSPAQLARILDEEGLRWYQEQTYFTERPDPQFAEKRGQ